MKEIEIDEFRDILVDITEKIHQFCSQRGLRYFIGYGSLIGAVRHKGFIPWDDDIDLGMPRPDYEIFLKTFNGTFADTEVIAPEINPHFYMPFANVYRKGTLLKEEIATHHGFPVGVKVDLFPIDGAPADDAQYRKRRSRIDQWIRILFYKNVLLSHRWKKDKVLWFKTLVWKIAISPLSIPYIQRRIRALATANDFESSEYADKLSFPNPGNTRVKRSVFEHYIDVEFEGHVFKAPRDYDVYQKAIYGDYLSLPPVSQRVRYHGFHAWWL
ncbi:MAG: LicD family protein [Bacteroidales bacterium]|nr:LicD family protein [Bacteroidales bacterium]